MTRLFIAGTAVSRVRSRTCIKRLKFSAAFLWLALLSIGGATLIAQEASPSANSPGQRLPDGFQVIVKDQYNRTAIARSWRGGLNRIGLQASEAVNVEVYFGEANAGAVVTVTPLNGGRVISAPGGFVVDQEGFLDFQFQAGSEPGFYQVAVGSGNMEIGVHFWVLDKNNPEANRQVVIPGS